SGWTARCVWRRGNHRLAIYDRNARRPETDGGRSLYNDGAQLSAAPAGIFVRQASQIALYACSGGSGSCPSRHHPGRRAFAFQVHLLQEAGSIGEGAGSRHARPPGITDPADCPLLIVAVDTASVARGIPPVVTVLVVTVLVVTPRVEAVAVITVTVITPPVETFPVVTAVIATESVIALAVIPPPVVAVAVITPLVVAGGVIVIGDGGEARRDRTDPWFRRRRCHCQGGR